MKNGVSSAVFLLGSAVGHQSREVAAEREVCVSK
jgi:hypothetical protein